MIRPTALLVFLMLSASLAGCIEDPIIEEPVSEEDPSIDDTDDVINGSNGGSGTDTGTDDGNSDNNNGGEPVNETDTGNGNDNTDDGSETDNGNSGNDGNETETDDNDGTDSEDGSGSNSDDNDGTDPEDGSGSDSGDNGGTDPGDGGSTGTTECGTGDGTYSSTMIAFDISANPDFTNIGGIEIDCSTNLLYGYAWDSAADVEHFISIDPSNGLVTSLAELVGIETVSSMSAYSNGEYFANMRGGSNDYLVHVTVSDPSQYTMTLFDFSAHPELDNVGGLEYNHEDEIIYAYATDDTNSGSQGQGQGQQNTITYPDVYVVSINPIDAVVTKHTQIEDIEGVGSGTSAYDGSHYYLDVRNSGGGYSMVKINTIDYSMTTSTVLQSTNEDLSNAGGFEINLVDGLIYGYAYDSQAGVEVFVSYDVASESVVQIGNIDGVQYVTSSSTNGGNDFYAIMSGSDRVSKLVHITY
ncbi:MAG: hypothetical protein P8R00_04525 [Candidatus Poseidoniaceae archaeon]|nr:hypothetical protein [Candidatus Poseidoniaceae archaeon]